MARYRLSRWCAAILAVSALAALPGCLVVRLTDHRIRVNEDGSGEAVLRLADVRSDGESDSAVVRDFTVMMESFASDTVEGFETQGRRVTGKRFALRSDTLDAEISYTFTSLSGLEGVHVTTREIYVVVGEEREIVRTNGKVSNMGGGAARISWPADAQRISYQIRERSLPASVSLARLYRERIR